VAGTKECNVIRAIAALALASATTQPTPSLVSSAPWWEKLTVTIAGDGQPQGCQFESSTKPQAAQNCDVTGGEKATMSSAAGSSSGTKDEYTRITFERRFSPGTQPDLGKLQAGDTLIGGQIMALAIDALGQVKGCKIVAETGSMRPQYGCDEASAERFQASAARAPEREGYMAVLVYGHSEHVV
jgi:hypothetical protein